MVPSGNVIPSFAGMSVSAAPVERRHRRVIFLEHESSEWKSPSGVLAQRLRAGRGIVLVGLFHLGVTDELVEESGLTKASTPVMVSPLSSVSMSRSTSRHLAWTFVPAVPSTKSTDCWTRPNSSK